MRTFLAMLLGKLARRALRVVRRGGGSALPGTIARIIQPKLLEQAVSSAPLGLVVVSGSAGKSSTTKILVELLRAHGLRVFTNPSTANIRQGFFAAVLQFGDLRGRIDADIVVFEWDEGHGAALSKELRPRLAVITNVLSDQLDRFIDPVFVTQKITEIANNSESILFNAGDKNLTQSLVSHGNVKTFGLSQGLLSAPEAPRYALNFGEKSVIKPDYAVMATSDSKVNISWASESADFKQSGDNLSQALNLTAAMGAADLLVELDISKSQSVVASMPPVFARDELASIRGRDVRLMLVQNPTSFQLNLSQLGEHPKPLMLMAGRDIHDPSWLWTVDFSSLCRVDVVAGFNAFDLALRLKYQGVEIGSIIPEIDVSVEAFLELDGESPTIMFSADAMRRTRRYLGLAK